MDQFLADYYGTGNISETEDPDQLEKMAQLVMLEKMAEDEGIDLSGLSDDEVVALAGEVFEDDEGIQPSSDQLEKEAAAKFEEADFLGKVMAHSMWNELDAIQKEAKGYGPGAPAAQFDREVARIAKQKQQAAAAARDASKYEGAAAAGARKGGATSPGRVEAGLRSMRQRAGAGADRAKRGVVGAGKAVGRGAATAGKYVAKHKLPFAGGAAGVAALTAGGLTARHLMKKREGEKTSSAFDSLADARAYEILQVNGLADEYGNVITPDQLYGSEKTAADVLQENVNEAAMLRLAEMGYSFE